MEKILITGGAGFIGSNFIRHLLARHQDYCVVNLDKLTYAGNLENLDDLAGHPRYKFVKGDICDKELVETIVKETDSIVNFAAESHVDRSIDAPLNFFQTNVAGTQTLLEAGRRHKIRRFLQISTDEVYGSIEKGFSSEGDGLKPNSPYSASKAAADILALAYYRMYNVPVLNIRCSNNFGQYQFPEKLIPLFITNILEEKEVPLYADGMNVRDWIYVLDNCEAIDVVFHEGRLGEVYNAGGGNHYTNLDITYTVLRELKKSNEFIKFVEDRPGHDKRYALNTDKIKRLGWTPKHDFKEAIKRTIDWYLNNTRWWKKLKEGKNDASDYKRDYSD